METKGTQAGGKEHARGGHHKLARREYALRPSLPAKFERIRMQEQTQ